MTSATSTALLSDKEEHVRSILGQYGRVAVAFSGGADSSLLLRLALETLGTDKVLALTARSCLLGTAEIERAETWPVRHHFQERLVHEFVDLDPLGWQEFVRNPADRCYLCKSRVYSHFLKLAAAKGFHVLVDGTNRDDLESDRPGLRAIRELGVETPLAAAGLTKEEVRQLSRELNLDTWDNPSASCLATRIPAGLAVTLERLNLIARLEAGLVDRGYFGCRVRLDKMDPETVTVQVRRRDLLRVATAGEPEVLLDFFSKNGMKKVLLDLQGR